MGPVRLPSSPITPGLALSEALRQRRSAYAFASRPVKLAALGALLAWSVGKARTVTLPGGETRSLPYAPTAGGLPSLDVFAVVRSVESLAPGVYRYAFEEHALGAVSTGDPTSLLALAYVQAEFAERAPLTIALVARLELALATYPMRHYRTLHMDAGVAGQTIALVATALGLGSCLVAGYRDDIVSDMLTLDASSLPMLLVAAGHVPDREADADARG